MGKKGSWLSAVKRVLSPESKGKKDKKPRHSKKRWFGKQKSLDVYFPPVETALVIPDHPPPAEEATLTEAETETEQRKHAYSVAVATALATEAAAAAAQAAAEVVRLTSASLYSGKFKEEIAATQIQTAFRRYLARRALRALRGLARLKSLIQGQSVKRQVNNTLKCMQTLARVQSQIHTRRLRMSEENQALQRQLLQKHKKEAEKLRASNGENWNDSAQSKEEVEAKLQHKQEAAMRRERALAYAHSQKTWRNSSKPANQTFMDSKNPHWGWGWLERWMAERPWESRSITTDRELNNDLVPLKVTRSRAVSDNKLSPTAQKPSHSPLRQSPSTPPSKAQSPTFGKTSPRGSASGTEDDSRSLRSVQPELYRRHSIASSSVGDEEGLASSSAAVVLSYMASTKSTKSRTRLPSPLGMISNGTPEKPSSAKKRLSFSSSSVGPSRHSGPPRVDTSSAKVIAVEI